MTSRGNGSLSNRAGSLDAAIFFWLMMMVAVGRMQLDLNPNNAAVSPGSSKEES